MIKIGQRQILLVGPSAELQGDVARYLESKGHRVDHIRQWFASLPTWPTGAPDLIVAHAESPNDRFGIVQLLDQFRSPPTVASIASVPATVAGCSYALRYPFEPAALDDILASFETSADRLPPPPSVSFGRAPIAPSRSEPGAPLAGHRSRVTMPSLPRSMDAFVRYAPDDSDFSDAILEDEPTDSLAAEFEDAVLEDEPILRPRPSSPPVSRVKAAFEVIADDDDEVLPLTDDALLEYDDSEERELDEAPMLGDDEVEEIFETEALVYEEGGQVEDKADGDLDGDAWGRNYRGPAGAAPVLGEVGGEALGTGARIWKKAWSVLPPEGELRGLMLVDVLHDCRVAERTGILVLSRQGHEKRVFFAAGNPVWADSALREETLGAYLIKRGLISREQLQTALSLMQSSGKRLGECLIDMKVLRAQDAYRHLSAHIQAKIVSAFGWHEGRYRFEPLEAIPGAVMRIPMSVPSLVIQGMRAHFNPYHLPYELSEMSRAAAFSLKEPAYHEDELGLSETAARVRDALQGGATIGSLRPRLGAEQDQVMGIAYALYALQVIGFSDRPVEPKPVDIGDLSGPMSLCDDIYDEVNQVGDDFMEDYMRLSSLNGFELLGIPSETDDEDIINGAYQALRSRLHPSCFKPKDIGALASKVEELWAQISLAHRTLSTQDGRAKYRRSLGMDAGVADVEETQNVEQGRALLAEAYFQKGRAALSEEDYDAALAAFDRALDAAPTDPAYLAHRAWTMYQADPAKNRQYAIAELNTVRTVDSSYAGVSYFLGRICLDDKALQIALGYFEMAVRADPNDADARRYLSHARSRIAAARQPAAPAEKARGFGRIFRRK